MTIALSNLSSRVIIVRPVLGLGKKRRLNAEGGWGSLFNTSLADNGIKKELNKLLN